MPDNITPQSYHGFLIVLAAAALAAVIVLPLLDMVLQKFGFTA